MNLDSLVNFCVANSSNTPKEEKRKVRAFIQVWISTTIIMWLYVLFSYSVYDFPTVGALGILYSFIHTLAPVIYRNSKSLTLTGLCISLSALAFQITFCIFNGGIHSPAAIWFTAHPVIISFFASKRLILFSIFLNMVIVFLLSYLGNNGYFPVDALTPSLTQIMMISSLIGLDIIIATYTIVFIKKTESYTEDLATRNELIENLMRIISHDINNSLNVSTLSARYLERHVEDDEKMMKKLELIKKSNQEINEITVSIKEWMKANDTVLRLKSELIPLSDVITYVKASFEDALKIKNISLVVVNSVHEVVTIVGDSRALRYQIINNVIYNAIKFSEEGTKITFKIDKEDDFIKFEVIDQGIGIPNNILRSIFDPSKSSSRKGTKGEAGTGFGMPIVKTLIECMHGSIRVESFEKSENNKESGTTINIKVPLCEKDL